MPDEERRDSATPQAAPQARLFVGVKIEPEIANRLASFAASFGLSSVRLIAAADIHLTLVPPWNEHSIPDAVAKLGCAVENFGAFTLDFRRVGYGPQPRRPHLIWVDCVVSDEGAALRNALLEAFGQTDPRPFQPHVTLARIRGNGQAIARRHPIDQPLSLAQRVTAIALFQSPPPGDSGYRILASAQLRDVPC